MANRVWQCNSCKKCSIDKPWSCPTCRVEVCDKCFDIYAHCKNCCERLIKNQLLSAAYIEGYDFYDD